MHTLQSLSIVLPITITITATDGFSRFKIIRVYGDRDNISGAPQRIREKEMEILLHDACLKEHIWKVSKHISHSTEFADVKVESPTKSGHLSGQF